MLVGVQDPRAFFYTLLYHKILKKSTVLGNYLQIIQENSSGVFQQRAVEKCYDNAPRNKSEKLIPPPMGGQEKPKCAPDKVGGARNGKNRQELGGAGGRHQ